VRAETRTEQTELVEQTEDVRGRLVDGGDHGALLVHGVTDFYLAGRQLLEVVHHDLRHERVQAGGRLVDEQQRGLRENLRRVVQALALVLGDVRAAGDGVADRLVALALEAHLHDGVLDQAVALRVVHRRQPALRLELQVLPHGQVRHEHLVLVHVRHQRVERLLPRLVVQQDLARRHRVVPRERVEQRGLARAAGAHDREQLARRRAAADVGKDVLRAAVGLRHAEVDAAPRQAHRHVLAPARLAIGGHGAVCCRLATRLCVCCST
jgi:uncharacterized membrane protein